MMRKILPAVSCNLDSDLLFSVLPLLESERVEAIEWSFDTLYSFEQIPEWFTDLLAEFSQAGRLIGHGVFFSLFSGKWMPEQSQWLESLRQLAQAHHFDHISEHFGFMTGADFHRGAPMSIPFTQSTLAIGQDRLKRISDACGRPVGLENLAFAYSLDGVRRHGDFLNQLLEPVNGFLIFDLHNFYCQLHNFELDTQTLLSAYPLERVREIHISGGSWDTTEARPARPVRRDTHDDSVPETVFALLDKVMPLCPNLKFVVLEQLGPALRSDAERRGFQHDFFRMEQAVQRFNQQQLRAVINDFLPVPFALNTDPLEDDALYQEQMQLTNILENTADLKTVQAQLAACGLADSAWQTRTWAPEMLESAIKIAQKWKHGF